MGCAFYQLSNLADDVAACLDAAGIEQSDVFGYSMSAGATLQLTIRYPEKPDQLVLATVSYDASGLQPEFQALIFWIAPEMFSSMPLPIMSYHKRWIPVEKFCASRTGPHQQTDSQTG